MVLPSDNEVDEDLCNYLRQTNDAELHLDHDYLDIEVDDMVMCINNQGQSQYDPSIPHKRTLIMSSTCYRFYS